MLDGWLIFADWVYDMQALIAGLLATAAAAVTIYFLRGQTKQIELHRDLDVKTNHSVSRALAISACSDFISSCKTSVRQLEETLSDWKQSTSSSSQSVHVSRSAFAGGQAPSLDLNFNVFLSKLIYGVSTKDRDFLTDFLSRIQIYNSRLKTHYEDLNSKTAIISEMNFYSRIVDMVILENFANCILKYGRDTELKCIPNLAANVSNTLVFDSNCFHNDQFQKQLERISWPPKPICERQRDHYS